MEALIMQKTIADLPDELLVHVMSLLDMHHLLQEVRAVSRRWRVLAVDPQVWKRGGRSISLGPSEPVELWAARNARALRLAPRLRHVSAGLDTLSDAMAELLCSTQCVFRALYICVNDASQWARTLPLALRVLRHLAPSLRELDLGMGGGTQPQRSLPSEWLALLQEALSMRGLESMGLSGVKYKRGRRIAPLDVALRGPAFLKELDLGPSAGVWLTCSLLEAHRHTLTALRLVELPTMSLEVVHHALAQCAQLRELRVPAKNYLPDILSRLPNLTCLVLELKNSLLSLGKSLSTRRKTEWTNYFRFAVKLTRLAFQVEEHSWCSDVSDDTWELMFSWLRVLASSGNAALETLRFSCCITSEDFTGFERVLAGLPRLRNLSLSETYMSQGIESLLDCISKDSAPSLEWLSGYRGGWENSPEFEPLQRLLARHPQLHFSGICFRHQEHEDLGHGEDPCSDRECGLLAPEHSQSPCPTCQRVSAAESLGVYWHRFREGGFWGSS